MIKGYQVRGFDLHEYECDGGIWCLYSDVEPIFAEVDELKRKLAVFTDGIEILKETAPRIQCAFHYERKLCEWLDRITEVAK